MCYIIVGISCVPTDLCICEYVEFACVCTENIPRAHRACTVFACVRVCDVSEIGCTGRGKLRCSRRVLECVCACVRTSCAVPLGGGSKTGLHLAHAVDNTLTVPFAASKSECRKRKTSSVFAGGASVPPRRAFFERLKMMAMAMPVLSSRLAFGSRSSHSTGNACVCLCV